MAMPPLKVQLVAEKRDTALGLVPEANGEPATVVSAPLLASTANADISLLPPLPTYKYFLSIVLAIAYGDMPVVTGELTEVIAPVDASIKYAEMVSAPEFAIYENSPHKILTLEISAALVDVTVKYEFCTTHRCAGESGCRRIPTPCTLGPGLSGGNM